MHGKTGSGVAGRLRNVLSDRLGAADRRNSARPIQGLYAGFRPGGEATNAVNAPVVALTVCYPSSMRLKKSTSSAISTGRGAWN